MPKVVIQCADEAAQVDFPSQQGVAAAGTIRTTGVIHDADRPILLWLHRLAPGAGIVFDQPPVGHCVYVLEGSIEAGSIAANAQALGTGGAVLIEHKGKAAVRAADGGAMLAHYHQRPGSPVPPPRAGGHVHIAGPEGAYKVTVAHGGGVLTVWGDSGCPTCELWLHRSDLSGPREQPFSHYHTDHEIIFFLRGEMILGKNRMLKPRTALAIDANTHYKFNTGPAGVSFINFRCTEPLYVQKQADGSHIAYNEREYVKYRGNTPAIPVPS